MRPRIPQIATALLIYVITCISVSAAPRQRIMMHTYQDGPSVVFLSFVDSPSGAVAIFKRAGSLPEHRTCLISRKQLKMHGPA